MDTKIKKSCPNCSQFYQLQSLSSHKHGNIPLFLSCGHSMCENCVRNIVKFAEPIECKVCHKDTEIEADELTSLTQNNITIYDIFPVNVYMLGELAAQMVQAKVINNEPDKDFYINIKSLLQNKANKGNCLECHSATSKMCQQCGTIVCNNCFNKSHKNFVIFKNHVLQNIETNLEQSSCSTHKDKPLGYYCKDCLKAICMDCLMVGGEKSCKNHNAVSIQEVNEDILAELGEISPKVDEMLKRLTKTAVDIGNILTNMENNSSSSDATALINEIEQYYSQLMSYLQKQKDEITDKISKMMTAEKDSLILAKNQISEAIKKAKNTQDDINAVEPKNMQQLNLSVFLEAAKQVIETPWYLTQEKPENPIVIKVKEDIFPALKDYVSLEGDDNSVYKLCTTKELSDNNADIPAPPPSIVYPPDLVKDVREMAKPKIEKEAPKETHKNPTFFKRAPTYRSKSGSCSSLNSVNSESSQTSYLYDQHYRMPVEPVMPFPESQHSTHLREGDQELIYISHIVDPHNFFVQRACHQGKVEELLREFRNASSKPKPSLSHVAEGKIYLAYIKADNLWQRCRIVSIDRKDVNKPVFQVFCIDFGSTEMVTIDKLRLLPPARIQSPPPLAINCCLAYCEPITGSWVGEDALLIQKIIDNKQAVLHVRHVRSGSSGFSVHCDVITVEDGVSVAHALAFHGRARLLSHMPLPKIMGMIEKPKIYINNNDFRPNAIEEVYITHIVSPDNFYVRKRHLQSVYEKLSEDLEQEYSLSVNTGSIYLPEKNMVCVVNVERTAVAGVRWARASVLELPGRARVRVLLVDTGAQVLVHWGALRRLLPRFATLRALTTECHLAGVTPLQKKWSPGSVDLLQKFEDRILEMQVEDKRSRGSVGVILYDKSDEDNVICVNTEMIKYKFAVTFGNTETEDLVITKKSPLDNPKPNAIKAPSVKVLKKEPVKHHPQKEKDLEAKDKGPIRLEAKILNYQSPSLIYVSLVHQQKVFNELYENIQKYYTKKKTQAKGDWKVEDRCCTVCIQSQTWRRAAILEINGDNAKVFYSDFACVETVPISNLRNIPPEFASIGDAAVMCHLCGVIPAVGEEWPSLTKEYLKELLDAYPRVFITKLGKFKGKSMPVELWVYHTIQGGALEANTSEWRCLNKKIIEQGLGIPDKTQELSSNDGTTENAGDDTISFLNVTGSIQDWLQIEPMPLKPLKVKSDTESNSQSPTLTEVDEDIAEEDPQSSNTVFISDWLPPEPLPSKEFTAFPTYIDNDGVIYLHDIAQEDTLDLIRKALDVRFKNPDPKAKFTKWTVGEPCIALFFLDNRFYRGRVVEVNNETSTCLIHYIDYGNEESCSFANLRKSIALYQIPIQAHRCVLSRIRPIKKQWDRQTLDYIHKSVVEKQCFAVVTGEPIGDLIPIELKYNKLWINDHLVEFEMATYTDGSKAVVQKYAANVEDNKNIEESYVHETDSGPDFIIEHDNTGLSDSFNIESLENKDWSQLVEEDEEENRLTGKFITFPEFTEKQFLCDITVLNEVNKLELSVKHDDDIATEYANLFEDIKSKGANMSGLNGIFENKACIALFSDGDWYRASILQYSENKGKVKVKYVDYGNIEVISLADVREITEEYTKLPPATVTAMLHGVQVNPEINMNVMLEHYTDTFLDKGPFVAEVITYKNSLPCVELRDAERKLIYESLIEKGLFIKSY